MELPKRKSMRLQGYDYSTAGLYFITLCVKDKQCLLWDIKTTTNCTCLSDYGMAIEHEITRLDEIYQNTVQIQKYVIMPNHIHMMIALQPNEDGRPWSTDLTMQNDYVDTPTISRIIKQFKRSISKRIGVSLWQKSFHDHIIRNEAEYLEIWQYIENNPLKWIEDCYYMQ